MSTTDHEAHVMKMADGGFRPASNAQLAVDVQSQLIAAVAITNSGSDMRQMSPMHQDIVQRYATTPEYWLADGGFTKLEAIDELSKRGTQPVLPPPRSRNPEIDRLAPKDTDTLAQAHWRAFMSSEFAKDLYIWRGASVECANAQLRRRGLHRFNVCGMVKARAVLLWHALAHNLMRMRSLGLAPTSLIGRIAAPYTRLQPPRNASMQPTGRTRSGRHQLLHTPTGIGFTTSVLIGWR